jgi:hypothetical protein
MAMVRVVLHPHTLRSEARRRQVRILHIAVTAMRTQNKAPMRSPASLSRSRWTAFIAANRAALARVVAGGAPTAPQHLGKISFLPLTLH